MDSIITFDKVQAVVWVVTLAFVVYNAFKKPQIKQEELFSTFKQQFDDFKEYHQEKHNQLQADIANLAQNHVHSVEMRVGDLEKGMSRLDNGFTKLSTIIEERFPKK